MDAVRFAIVGIHGWGVVHLRDIEGLEQEGLAELVAVSTRRPDRPSEKLDELRARGVRVYSDYRELLAGEPELEVLSLPTPLHLHVPMALTCFERGVDVLLEKPPAALVQDVDRIAAAAEAHGRLCQVGFQCVSDPSAQELKRRILGGEIGAVREVIVQGYWRRTDAYYERSSWAGKVRVGDSWVLDGPLNNPLCHYVQEGLFLAGPDANSTARPVSVQAELYRAHDIEGEDIACVRAELDGGARMLTYLTLCAPKHNPPSVQVIGERGRAKWSPGRYEIETQAGREEHTSEGPTDGLFRNLAAAVRSGEELISPVPTTRNVILHNNGCYASSGRVWRVPAEHVVRSVSTQEEEEGQIATDVSGLMEAFERAAAERKLFSEIGVEWAVPTKPVTTDFDEFDPSPLLE